jgi:hypothetical protein
MGEALDRGDLGDIPSEADDARLKLEDAMLSVGIERDIHVAVLKAGALHAMAMLKKREKQMELGLVQQNDLPDYQIIEREWNGGR